MKLETTLTIRDLMDLKRGIECRIRVLNNDLIPTAKEQRIKDIYFEELERMKELSKRLRYL